MHVLKVGGTGQTRQRHNCTPPESRRYGANSLEGMTGLIGVDRGRGIYVHETDKKSIDGLKRRKVDRRLIRGRWRVDRRQAAVASKDQIQHCLVISIKHVEKSPTR